MYFIRFQKWANIQILRKNDQTYWRCSVKKVFLKISQYSLEHICDGQAFRSATLQKRNSNTGVFLWILRNFYEHLFRKTMQTTASVTSFVTWPRQFACTCPLKSSFQDISYAVLTNQYLKFLSYKNFVIIIVWEKIFLK